MAPATDIDGLRAAWRALAGEQEGEGWKTISITAGAQWRLLAGRHLPGDEEALLVGFSAGRFPTSGLLPRGQGFEVAVLPSISSLGDGSWIVLSRRSSGRPELFAAMALDLVRLLEGLGTTEHNTLPGRLIARIRAWQEFMDKRPADMLSPESELGLWGELAVLDGIIAAGVPAQNAVEAWRGPLDGMQDFAFGRGGIEVKASTSAGSFSAVINSIEQLDDGLCQPLFLAAVRSFVDPSGITLPEMAEAVRRSLSASFACLDAYEGLLLRAGLFRMTTDHYTRRFMPKSISLFQVSGAFPRLTRDNIPPAVRKARYELDVDLAGWPETPLSRALEMLGAI
jgi:hypothetical protein